jgi:hypothetical protein
MSFLSIQNLDRYVGRWFRDLRLKQLLEYHMVFLGSSPFQAPAIYSLMSHLDFKSGVYYPRRGMLSLIDAIALNGEGLIKTFVKGELNCHSNEVNRLWHHYMLPIRSRESYASEKTYFNGRYYKNGGNFS